MLTLVLLLSLTQNPGPARVLVDDSPEVDVARLGWSFVMVWADDRRHRAFGGPSSAGTDLWLNRGLADGGLQYPWGLPVRFGERGEWQSQPRIAFKGSSPHVAWRRTKAPDAGWAVVVAGFDTAERVGALQVLQSGSGLTSLRLAGGDAAVLAVWERPGVVEAQLVPSTLGVLSRPTDSATPDASFFASPTVAATPVTSAAPFFLAWHDGSLHSVAVNGLGLGTVTEQTLAASSPLRGVAVGPWARLAFTRETGAGRQLFFGEPQGAVVALEVTSGGRFLAAGVEGTTGEAFVAHQAPDQQHRVLKVLGSGFSAYALPTTFEPGALTTVGGVAVVVNEPSRALIPTIVRVDPLASPNLKVVSTSLVRGDDELLPSFATSSAGQWLVAVNRVPLSGATELALEPASEGTITTSPPQVPLPSDHFARLILSPGRRTAGLSRSSATQSRVYEDAEHALADPSAQPLLSVEDDSLPLAALGQQLAVQWSADTGRVRWGRDDAGTRVLSAGHRLDRCGAWDEAAQRSLWLTALNPANTQALRLYRIADEFPLLGAQPADADLVEDFLLPTQVSSAPCLALKGTRGLVTFLDASKQVVALELATSPPKLGALHVVARSGLSPVAAPSGADWFVAWEQSGIVFSTIFGRHVLADGGLSAPEAYSSPGADARNPVVFVAPSGEVLLAWQEFRANTANAVVQWQVVPQVVSDGGGDAGLEDAGVDGGGLVDGGGAGADAGLVDAGSADGGLDPGPLALTSCGCAADGASLLLLLGLAVLRRRAR